MNKFLGLIIILLSSLACGGGGGGEGDSVAGGFTGSSGNPNAKASIIVDSSQADEVEIIHLESGNTQTVALETNQTAEVYLDSGEYEFKAELNDGGLLRKKVTIAAEDLSVTIDEVSTTAVLLEEVENLTTDDAVELVENLGYQSDEILSSSSESDTNKNAALIVLSLLESVSSTNEDGQGAELLSGSTYVTESRIRDNRDKALKAVISEKGSVLIPVAGGIFLGTTSTDVDNNSQNLDLLVKLQTSYVKNYVSGENNAPIADAGDDELRGPGEEVTLNANRSFDADGDYLTYTWSQIGGQTVILLDLEADKNANNVANPFFNTPFTEGNLIFQLVVHDGQTYSLTDTITIEVDFDSVNAVPQVITTNQTVGRGDDVTLSATGFDGDGDSLLYSWDQIYGDTVLLQNPTSSNPTFTAPDADAILRFNVTVFDGKASSESATSVITVTDNVNNKPVVFSEAPQVGVDGVQVSYQIDAQDFDGESLTYDLIEYEEGMSLSSTGLFTWTSQETGTFSVNIEISDSRDVIYHSFDLEILANGTSEVVSLGKTFSTEATLDFSGGDVDLGGAEIESGVDVTIIAKTVIVSDNLDINGNLYLETE